MFYNLQDISSQDIINTVIRRIKNGRVKSGGKNKPLALTKAHRQIDSSLCYRFMQKKLEAILPYNMEIIPDCNCIQPCVWDKPAVPFSLEDCARLT